MRQDVEYNKALSFHQTMVLNAFNIADIDIPLENLYRSVYGIEQAIGMTAREMQQKLGPSFSAVNEKLTNARIEPGKTKRTYRLTIIEE